MELVSAGLHCLKLFKKYWFLSGLFAVCISTLADSAGILAALGRRLKQHHGPDLVIVFIFLFSGFALSIKQLRDGLMDVKGMWIVYHKGEIFSPTKIEIKFS